MPCFTGPRENQTYTPMILQTGPAAREAHPTHRRWENEAQEGFPALEERFREWGAWIDENEELFRRNVYQSEDANEGDFRQHRIRLCAMMAEGESLALDFLIFLEREPNEEGDAYVKLVDQKVAALRSTFFQWHGPIEAQTDIPQDFIDGVRDLNSGKIVDMEVALTQTPPGV